MTTNARHIAIAPTSASKFDDVAAPDVASSPNGNAVSLEMEMIKVSDTQAQFQAAANLYAKAMTLMKTAIGH
jgi:flagellar basal-body rod protein FlgB